LPDEAGQALFGNRWYQPSQRANKVPETIAGAIWTSAIAAGRGQIDQNLALICKAQQSGKFVSSAKMPTPGIVNLAARGMLVVSVAARVGRSFARLLCCLALTERGRKKALWVR